MSRWTQTWLSGAAGAADDPAGDANLDPPYRGERLGLPADGPGSAAGFGSRLLAICVDWFPCLVAAHLFTTNPTFSALALFAALTVLSLVIWGRTPGHAAAGLRVAQVGTGDRAGFSASVLRTVLLCLAIPPLVYDLDGRGLHDKAAGTVVLRTR